jgi:hypothetical protein
MASCASSFAVEHMFAASRCGSIKVSARRNRGEETELIVQQFRQLRRDAIRLLCDEEPDARIVEGALAAHLRHTDVAIPIGDRAVARIGLEPDALQSIRRWNEYGQRWWGYSAESAAEQCSPRRTHGVVDRIFRVPTC